MSRNEKKICAQHGPGTEWRIVPDIKLMIVDNFVAYINLCQYGQIFSRLFCVMQCVYVCVYVENIRREVEK